MPVMFASVVNMKPWFPQAFYNPFPSRIKFGTISLWISLRDSRNLKAKHAGIRRTYARLVAKFYWKGIKKHVQDYVNACDVCQRSKYEAMVPTGLLQPLPIQDQVWDDITMNFIEGLPKSQGFNSISVVVN